MKQTPILASAAEALNAIGNNPTPVPGVNPGVPGSLTGYGTIGSTQQNFPRQLQLSLKVLF